MRSLFLLLLAALVAFSADDDWAKVKSVKTGAELRIYKKGSAQPVLAQMGELTDDNLIVLIKKTESAIPRDQIDRIDARPLAKRVTKETSDKTSLGSDGQVNSSSSAGYSFGRKPDFEMVFRRVAPPKK
jgi:hypothetical protein